MRTEQLKTKSKGAARDVIIVNPAYPSSENQVTCCDFLVQIFSIRYKLSDSKCALIHVQVNENVIDQMQMSLIGEQCRFIRASEESPFRPPSDTLKKVVQFLNPGRNTIQYLVSSEPGITQPDFIIESHIHLWSSSDSIVVCDIDGTITKSNMHGYFDHTHVHRGICHFFSNLVSYSDSFSHSITNITKEKKTNLDTENQDKCTKSDIPSTCPNKNLRDKKPTIRFLYLTSRPMTLFEVTKTFLMNLSQENKHLLKEQEVAKHSELSNHDKSSYFNLPPGAIFCQKGNLVNALFLEMIKKAKNTKQKTLSTQIVVPFETAGRPLNSNLFIAGFGNMETDSDAYQSVGINIEDIYIIDEKSQIRCLSWMKHGNANSEKSHKTQKSKELQDETDSYQSFSSKDASQNQNNKKMESKSTSSHHGMIDRVVNTRHVSLGESINVSNTKKNLKNMKPSNFFDRFLSKSSDNETSLDAQNFTFDSYDDRRLLRKIQKTIDVKMCR